MNFLFDVFWPFLTDKCFFWLNANVVFPLDVVVGRIYCVGTFVPFFVYVVLKLPGRFFTYCLTPLINAFLSRLYRVTPGKKRNRATNIKKRKIHPTPYPFFVHRYKKTRLWDGEGAISHVDQFPSNFFPRIPAIDKKGLVVHIKILVCVGCRISIEKNSRLMVLKQSLCVERKKYTR